MALFAFAAVFFLTIVVRTAWISDDAYITFRTIDNWRNGYGLRWNVDERVQAYTHPLWLFALAAAGRITNEPYFSSIGLSIACAFTAAVLLAGSVRRWWLGGAALILLSTTQSFVDYATSGLETPMTYLLIAAFGCVYWSKQTVQDRAFQCAALAALLGVNRLDALALVAPPLLHLAWRARQHGVWRIAVGLMPLVIWEVFSIVYYGSLVPNTAYAKLGHGIPQGELTQQGMSYLVNSVRADPATLTTIGGAIALSTWLARAETAAAAAGIALHVMYVVQVGGDFMSGRFLAPPLVFAVAVLLKHPSTHSQRVAVGCAMLLLGVAQLPTAVARAWPSRPLPAVETLIDSAGIADERRIYARETSLMDAIRRREAPHPAWEQTGRRMRELGVRVMTRDSVGFFGYGAGPSVHIIDTLALCDPLLARLPARRPARIGHFYRDLPEGYVDLLRGRTHVLRDPRLNGFYAAVRLVTRGPIWSRERWGAILRLNQQPLYARSPGTE